MAHKAGSTEHHHKAADGFKHGVHAKAGHHGLMHHKGKHHGSKSLVASPSNVGALGHKEGPGLKHH